GYKLDPTLINALVERWRPETHPFHLTCDECTITFENITLQLSLAMDGPFVTGAVIIPGKEDLCETFLGKILKFCTHKVATTSGRLQRMWSTELGISCVGHVVPGVSWAWWRLPFLRPRVDTPYTFSLVTRWNHGPRYVGLPEQLKDIRLLLDQRSKFEDVKVFLVVYTTMEMHESDRVMLQFKWRQNISLPLQDIKTLHKLDLWGKTNEN
ncbi:hypothetical protein Goarm_020234, partial [Gossypium armourianum]|nr:hypothetical protein [Gossypium armourianum]